MEGANGGFEPTSLSPKHSAFPGSEGVWHPGISGLERIGVFGVHPHPMPKSPHSPPTVSQSCSLPLGEQRHPIQADGRSKKKVGFLLIVEVISADDWKNLNHL